MPIQSCKNLLKVLIAWIVLAGCPSTWANYQSIESVMKLIPESSPGAIVIPSLKKLNDELTQMLEGMDRANLLIGSRPIDQMKSFTGFNVAVNDFGGAAIVAFIENEQPIPAIIIPVTDAQAFLNGNLKPQGDLAYALPDGKVVYAKSLSSHVIVSPSEAVIHEYQLHDDSLAKLQSALGERTVPLLNSSDALIVVRGNGIRMLRQSVEKLAGEHAAQIMPADLDLLFSVETGLAVFDLDPLGLAVRTLAVFQPDSAIGKNARQAQTNGNALGGLPNKPFYFASDVDLQAWGGPEALHGILGEARASRLPSWFNNVNQIQFAAYPSPAGAAGGLLNDSALVLGSSDPAALAGSIKQSCLAKKEMAQGVAREVKWEDARHVEGVGNVSAFEIRTVNSPPEAAVQLMVEQFIFGRSAIRGFVHPTSNAVIVTFSQRPAVLKSAIEASLKPESALATSPVVQSIQSWLPVNQDVQIYVGLGELARMVQQIASTFRVANQMRWPEFDANLPPIAMGADVIDHGVESAVVVPAGVLAMMIDQMIANMPRTPEHQPADAP
jgi:hypothetical protein